MTEYVTKTPLQTSFSRTIVEQATLRDQFAMAALTGLLSDPERDAEPSEYGEWAYLYADVMLAAREEKK